MSTVNQPFPARPLVEHEPPAASPATPARRTNLSALESFEDRRARWTANRETNQLTAAEATIAQQAEQIAVLIRQRDEALRRAPKRPLIVPEATEQILAARRERDDAIAMRDEARGAWDRLRTANAELMAQLAAFKAQIDELKAQLAARPPAASSNGSAPSEKPKRERPAQQFPDVPPVEVSPEEAALEHLRAELVAEMTRCETEVQRLGKWHGAGARARVTAINGELAALKPRLQAYKQVRHFEKMAREAEAMRDEAQKTLEAPP